MQQTWKRYVSALLTFVSLNLGSSAMAETYYVATTGSNQGGGSQSDPWRTIAYGAKQLYPGDTLYVRGGLYPEHLKDVIPSGTEDAWVTVAGYPGERPVLNPSGVTSGDGPIQFYKVPTSYVVVRNFVIDPDARSGSGNGVTVLRQHHHLTFEGIEVRNVGRHGINSGAAAHHIIWRRMYVHHVGNTNLHHAAYISSSDTVIEDSEFSHASQYCLHVYYSDTASGILPVNVVVRRNYVHHNKLGAISSYLMQAVRWHNNVIVDNAIDGLRLGNASGHVAYHNTLYNNGGYDLQILTENSGAVVVNNLIGKVFGQGRAGYWLQNLVGPHAAFSSALYHLAPGSPAIDGGTWLAEIDVDKDGTPRPQGVTSDVGAYEHADTVAPAVPTDVKLASPCRRTMDVSWKAPTVNTDGTPLTDLAGYRLYVRFILRHVPQGWQPPIEAGLATAYRVEGLQSGARYGFAVTAVDAAGNEGPMSSAPSKIVSYDDCPQ